LAVLDLPSLRATLCLGDLHLGNLLILERDVASDVAVHRRIAAARSQSSEAIRARAREASRADFGVGIWGFYPKLE
jgi:hypothetical protein